MLDLLACLFMALVMSASLLRIWVVIAYLNQPPSIASRALSKANRSPDHNASALMPESEASEAPSDASQSSNH